MFSHVIGMIFDHGLPCTAACPVRSGTVTATTAPAVSTSRPASTTNRPASTAAVAASMVAAASTAAAASHRASTTSPAPRTSLPPRGECHPAVSDVTLVLFNVHDNKA